MGFISSCSYSERDFDLCEKERNLFRPFKKGDTIYYENSNKELDAILVLGIDSSQKRESGWIMAKSAYNEVFVSIKHLSCNECNGSTYFNGDKNGIDPEYEYIISISKYPQQQKTAYSISFKHFFYYNENTLGEFSSDTIVMNGKRLVNYYVINGGTDNPNSTIGIELNAFTGRKIQG